MIWCVALATLALVSNVPAAALNNKMVAADAKWLFHADFDGLKASKVGGALYKMLEAGPLKEANQKMSQELGIELDFNKGLYVTLLPLFIAHNSTFYSNNRLLPCTC